MPDVVARRHLASRQASLVATLLVVVCVGCGKGYDVGEVTGKVTINGQPGDEITIQFSPTGGTQGPSSFAKTDDQGRFELRLVDNDGHTMPGAIVGSHKVVLYDTRLGNSATGRGVPFRLKPEYSLPGSTPLSEEVKPGEQVIDIVVP